MTHHLPGLSAMLIQQQRALPALGDRLGDRGSGPGRERERLAAPALAAHGFGPATLLVEVLDVERAGLGNAQPGQQQADERMPGGHGGLGRLEERDGLVTVEPKPRRVVRDLRAADVLDGFRSR